MKKLFFILFFIFMISFAVGENMPSGGGGRPVTLIEEEVEEILEDTEICGNDICQEGESYTNCPNDCTFMDNITKSNLKWLIVFGAVVYWWVFRKKKDYKINDKLESTYYDRYELAKPKEPKPIKEELFYKEI